MKKLTRLAFLLCLPLTVSAVSHSAFAATVEQQISARLDALENENAALKQRLKRIEGSAATSRHALPPPGRPAGSEALDAPAWDAHAQDGRPPLVYKSPVMATSNPPHHFEISGSLLYLQPGSDDLEYATLVSPLPCQRPIGPISRSARATAPPSVSASATFPSSPTISN
jgi:hypothetical protein